MTGGASTIVEFKWSVRRRRKFSEIQAPKHHFLVENSLKRSQNTTKHHKNTKNPEKSASGGGQINNFTPLVSDRRLTRGVKLLFFSPKPSKYPIFFRACGGLSQKIPFSVFPKPSLQQFERK